MEEPVDVTTDMSKNLKAAAENMPANLNTTNGDCLARQLFGTPDSKELLMQTHLKVTLVVVSSSSSSSSSRIVVVVVVVVVEMGRACGMYGRG